METHKNVAGVAGMAFLGESDYGGGFEIEIYKKIKAGSGIGSSAASSTGAVWGMNQLLGRPFTTLKLVEFAMEVDGARAWRFALDLLGEDLKLFDRCGALEVSCGEHDAFVAFFEVCSEVTAGGGFA